MTGRLHRSAGFTLAELMVALTIGATVVTLLVTALQAIIRFQDSPGARRDTSVEAMDRLRLGRFLGSVVARSGPAVGLPVTLESATRGSVLTARISPGAFDSPGTVTDPCRLEIRTDDTPGVMVRVISMDDEDTLQQTAAVPPAVSAGSVISESRLFRDRWGCRIETLGCDGEWRTEWPPAALEVYPQAIRLRFPDGGDPAGNFPDIVIAIPVAGRCDDPVETGFVASDRSNG